MNQLFPNHKKYKELTQYCHKCLIGIFVKIYPGLVIGSNLKIIKLRLDKFALVPPLALIYSSFKLLKQGLVQARAGTGLGPSP